MKKTDLLYIIEGMEMIADIASPSRIPWDAACNNWRGAYNLKEWKEDWKARDMTDYIDFLQGAIFG